MTEKLQKSYEWKEFLEELQDETDRGCALVGGAFLDEHLRQLLVAYMIDDEKEVIELISNTSLRTFNARIGLAYCLGLISHEALQDLRTLKSIRNDFAHQLHGLTFDDEGIQASCRELKIVTKLLPDENMSARNRFEIAVALYAQWLKIWALSTDHRVIRKDVDVAFRISSSGEKSQDH